MKLVVHELIATPLFQKIILKERDINVSFVRLHLYKALTSAGSLICQIWNEDQRVIAESSAVSINTISAANYFHGEVRFDVNAALKAEQVYYVALTSTGYTYSASNWVGWCNDWDLHKAELADDEILLSGLRNRPLLIEFWEQKQITEGNLYG